MILLLLFSCSIVSNSGFPVLHYLLEFAQTQVRWVSDAIQPSCPCLSLFLLPWSFPMCLLFISGGQSFGVSASAPVLPMSIQGWFLSGLTGLISLLCKDPQESSPSPQFESIISLALSLFYRPALRSVLDYWKNHSFDYMDLCQQSDVFAFNMLSRKHYYQKSCWNGDRIPAELFQILENYVVKGKHSIC